MIRPLLAFDTETDLITKTCKAPPLACVSFAGTDMGAGLFTWHEASPWGVSARDAVAWWLTGPWLLVGQNIAYDLAVLMVQWPELTPLIFNALESDRVTDTMVRQKLIDIAQGELDDPTRPNPYRVGKSAYSLEALSLRHLGLQLDKDTWRLRYGEFRHVPLAQWPEGARAYPIQDACSTLGVYQKQEPWACYLADQFRQTRHAFWLHLISAWGIRTDRARVAMLAQQTEQKIEGFRGQLLQAGLLRQEKKKGETVFVRDQKASRAFMAAACEAKGIQPKLTDKGAIALDLEACETSGHPVLEAYAEFTHLQNLLNKDVEALASGEVHARFNGLLATGRTSCSGNAEDGGYNLQNPARGDGVRECFIPREGTAFIDSDYDGLELRTMAQACLLLFGKSSLAPLLNAGDDPHLQMAAELAGCTYEQARARYEAHGMYEKGDPRGVRDDVIQDARQDSKPANFGFPGGMGAKTFVKYCAAQGRRISEEKAWELKRTWERIRPEFPGAYFPLHAALTENGPAQVEQFFSGRFRGGLSFTEACNTRFQGLGADAAKSAGWRLCRAMYDPSQGSVLYGSRLVNFVHDQFIAETPLGSADACARELGRIMVEEANRWLPDVPATTSPCLATCWSKHAKAVKDEHGRLVPWSPKTVEGRAA